MKIDISVLFDCLLVIGDKRYLMNAFSSRIEIEMEDEEVCLLFYPIQKKCISYMARLCLKNDKLNVDCPYAKISELGECEYEIIFEPFVICNKLPSKISKSLQANCNLWLLQGEINYFCVEDNQEFFLYDFEGGIIKYLFLSVGDKPAVKIWQEKEQKLFVFCSQNQHFDVFEGEINVDDIQIDVITPCNDFAKQAFAKKYVYENENLTTLSCELVYLEQKPQITHNVKVIPFAFFEAVKTKNFFLAKQYLSQNLVAKISAEMLEEYFGDFEEIKPYNFFISKGYYVCVQSKNQNKIFRINIENSQIVEIEQIRPKND